jgi:diguanylate cyclase (GGDEF)-like protein
MNPYKDYTQLAYDNRDSIAEHNQRMLSAALMGGLLLLLPLLAAPFSNTKKAAVPVYLLASTLFFLLFILSRFLFMKRHTLIGLYGCFSIFFGLAVYLSVIHSPDHRATILLGAFCLMPLGFIDRPSRMNLFAAFWFTVHTVLAFYLKPLYALDDTINCLCFAILGCYLGNLMVSVRLESYEAHRLLTIQKETDVLTGLFNRRRLFETLAVLETTDTEKPSGIMMLDIDYFKTFNDNYGHAVGDRYLSSLGEALKASTQNLRIQFYRYGGEEFLAIAYGYGMKELLSIAESLRTTIQGIGVEGYYTSASIGVAYCGDEQVRNYENVIDRADRAAYAAKSSGRNKVCVDTEINNGPALEHD